jgi:hypothetical protein
VLNLDLNQWDNLNPQLLREIKSRVNWRNSLMTIALSIVSQLLLIMSFVAKLPQTPELGQYYCTDTSNSLCVTDRLGNILIDWPRWWEHVSVGFSWTMVYVLALGGVYLLASNFSQEERRGTLDFIRLSPQKAGTIIIGKFAGVPILVYLGVALALPLQLHAVHQAGISRLSVLSWDLLMLMVSLLLYGGAVLAALWFKAPAIMLTGAAACLVYLNAHYSMNWLASRHFPRFKWYALSLDNNLPYYWGFSILAAVGVYWLYQALERRYLKPKSIVLSKPQSYLWSFLYHLFLLGFCLCPGSGSNAYQQAYQWGFNAPLGFGSYGYNDKSTSDAIVVLFGAAWLLLLIPLLLPGRQSLIEWARYHHLHRSTQPKQPNRSQRSEPWLKSLILDDQSPAILAVALNVLIGFGVWMIPLLFNRVLVSDLYRAERLPIGIILTTLLMAIYSTVAHWVMFWRVNHRHYWMTGIIAGLICLPLIGVAIFSQNTSPVGNLLFLISLLLWTSLKEVNPLALLLVIPLLMCVLFFLTLRFRQVLVKVGRSESYQQWTQDPAPLHL